MKKVLIILLAILTALFLVACNPNGDGGDDGNSGEISWEVTIDDSTDTFNVVYDLAIDSAGEYLYGVGYGKVTGATDDYNDYIVVKINAEDGATEWSQTYDLAHFTQSGDTGESICVYNDAVYVVGHSADNETGDNYDWFVSKLKTSDGTAYDTNWTDAKFFDGEASSLSKDYGRAIEADDSGVYVAGSWRVDDTTDSHSEFAVVKLSHTDGSIDDTWSEVKSFHYEDSDSIDDDLEEMVITDDTIYLLGVSQDTTSGNSGWLLGVNKTDGTESGLNKAYSGVTSFFDLAYEESTDSIYLLGSVNVGSGLGSVQWIVKKVSATDGTEVSGWGDSTDLGVIYGSEGTPDEDNLVDIPHDIVICGDYVYASGYVNLEYDFGKQLTVKSLPDIALIKLSSSDGSFASGWADGKTYDPIGGEEVPYGLVAYGDKLYMSAIVDESDAIDMLYLNGPYDWWVASFE